MFHHLQKKKSKVLHRFQKLEGEKQPLPEFNLFCFLKFLMAHIKLNII